MSSLTKCLARSGKLISRADADAIRRRAQDYIGEGMAPQSAALEAVRDQITEAQSELGTITEQLRGAGVELETEMVADTSAQPVASANPIDRMAQTFLGDLRREIGWDQVGGRMLRAPAKANDGMLAEVTGRTPWIGRASPFNRESMFWRDRPDKINEAAANAAFDKAERGQALNAAESRFIDYAESVARAYAEEMAEEMGQTLDVIEAMEFEARAAAADELRAQGAEFSPADEAEALALADLVDKAYDAGATSAQMLDITFDAKPAEQARQLWTLIKEARRGADTEASRVDNPGRSEASRGRQGADPAAAEQLAASAEAEPRPTLSLTSPAPLVGAPEPARAPSQSGLFAPPTQRERIEAAKREKDAERNGANGSGRTDILAGDGELFAGPRPAQTDIDGASAVQGSPLFRKNEQAAKLNAEPAPEKGARLPNATAPEHVRTVDGEQQTGVTVAELKQIAKDWRGFIDGGGDAAVTRIFEAPAKKDIVRLQDKVRVHVAGKGWMTPAEAKARIRAWEDNAVQQGKDSIEGKNRNGDKIVLSLFDLSGEWSAPWEQAGYQVYRFDIQDGGTYEDPETGEEKKIGDVHNMSVEFFSDLFGDFDGKDVHAILAACPCTDFAVSGARHFAAKDADGRTVSSVELVKKTLAAIEYFKPAVWALENPVGRIEELTGLPPWRLSFDPNHVGDPYTKKTLIWGRFNADLPIAPVEPTEGSKMHTQYGGKSQKTKNARSVTPEGFAYAFFQANNAIDNPMVAVSGKYDRLDRDAIKDALDAGLTESDIDDLVEDFYYGEMDDDAANEALREAAAAPKAELPDGWRRDGKDTFRNADPIAGGRVMKEQWGRWAVFPNNSSIRGLGEFGTLQEAIEALREAAAPKDAAAALAQMSADDLSALFDEVAGEFDAVPTELPEKERAKAPRKNTGAGDMAVREEQARQRFVDSATEQFGLSRPDALRALAELQRTKLVKLDPVDGQFKLKDGRAWDADVMRRAAAAGVQAPSAPKAPRKPRATRSPAEKIQSEGRSAADMAKSLGVNLSSGGVEALKGLSKLFGGPGRLNSGLSFDEKTYAQAKPHFQAMLRDFTAAGRDLRDLIREIINLFGTGVKPYLMRFAQEVQADAQRGSNDLERDRADAANGDGALGETGGYGAGRNGRGPEQGTGRGGRRGQDGPDLFDSGAAADGASGNQPLDSGERPAGDAVDPAGSDDDQRGGDAGGSGVQPDRDGSAGAAPSVGRRSAAERLALQREADRIPVEPANAENIRETLPLLLEGQQEDVLKAETRFAQPDGYGMLFTNGTGTGKTFTGLGVVKRFVRQGKGNILVLVPDDKIANDWIDSAGALNLKISQLPDTKTAGKGVVIATYANAGQNDTLAFREWDLVVADEAHSLSQNKDGTASLSLNTLRAITLHPAGVIDRSNMLHRDLIDRASAASDAAKGSRTSDDQRRWAEEGDLEAKASALWKQVQAKRDEVKAEVMANQGAARPRVLMLSATPFAYEKSIDMAEGYLFDYAPPGTEVDSLRYNSGDARERFFMQHFGYRMRYNKLTEPDAKVDRGIMQRQFNGWLKSQGVLSSRMLDVPADYDRKFVLVESQIGRRIDEALDWLSEMGRSEDGQAFRDVSDQLRNTFDYLNRRYLLEAIKAQESVQHVREHLAMGRKVVVFHDYKKGGGFNPFRLPEGADPAYMAAREQFSRKFADLVRADLHKMPSPVDLYRREFPDVLVVNGDEKARDILARYKRFNDDATGAQVMLVQAAKSAGWSGHDTTGKHQRVLINLGQPTQPTRAIQQEGRIYRVGQITDAIIRYFNTGTNWERWTFASTIAQRASAAENLAMGEYARALKDAFIEAFEDSSADYRAGHDGEGKGGKARDRQTNAAITEWDRAKTMYYGQRKRTSRDKSQEGIDYFATPEPLGLKMTEWADLRPGEGALEPSAGHGAIARWLRDDVERTAIEPSSELRSRLALVFGGGKTKINDGRFEDLNVVNKYDGIVMNPPFGTAGRTAVDHLAKAATHLRDGGRIVALLPAGPSADAKFDKWFYEEQQRPAKPVVISPAEGPIYLGDSVSVTGSSELRTGVVKHLPRMAADEIAVQFPGVTGVSVMPVRMVVKVTATGKRTETYKPAEGLALVADIKLPAVTFERAGTKVMSRVVVIEKPAQGTHAPQQRNIDLTDIEDINSLFDRLKDMELRPRAKPVEEVAEAAAGRGRQQGSAPAAGAVTGSVATAKGAAKPAGTLKRLPGEEWVEHVTGKGKTLRGVIRRGIDQAQAKELDPYTFRKEAGWFIREQHFADDDSPRFMRGRGSLGAPLTDQEVHRIAIARLDTDAANARIAVLPFDQLPAGIQEHAKAQQAPAEEVRAVHWKGVTYFVSGQFRSAAEVAEAVFHEHYGHFGLRAKFGRELVPELRRLLSRVGGIRGALDIARRQGVDLADDIRGVVADHGMSDEHKLARIMEELLTHMAEATGSLRRMVQEMVGAVRAWLRRSGYAELSEYGATDLAYVLRQAREAARNAQPPSPGQDDVPMFQRARQGVAVQESEAVTRQLGMLDALGKGQPLDRVIRKPFDMLGMLDSHGRLKAGAKLAAAAERILVEAKFSDTGRMAWANPLLEQARAGLVDRYGLSPDYVQRDAEREADERRIGLQAMDIVKRLTQSGVGVAEAKALQAVLTGEQVAEGDYAKLAEPVRQAIDEMGQEAVELGLISPESFERNRGAYLHRVYMKHEAVLEGSKLVKWVRDGLASRRRKIVGNSFKGRGMDLKVTMDQLRRGVPGDWWGSKLEAGQADKALKGAKFVVFDRFAASGEGTETAPGIEPGGPKSPRLLERIYWPADRAVPAKFEAWDNRGEWEVRDVLGGRVVLWRDFTKAERQSMGEILDARYTIAKTFQLMAHDLSTARFFADIAKNGEWSSMTEPGGTVVDAAAARRLTTWAGVDWVKVPDVTIPKSRAKKYGALSGAYVRAEIWRDLAELERMQEPGLWDSLLTQWKLNKTARSPVVHMNNVLSNMVFMDMADVRLQDLARGLHAYVKESGDYRAALENGAFGASMISQEIKRNVLEPLLREIADQNTAGADGKLGALSKLASRIWAGVKRFDDAMTSAYQLEDEVFRMATYMRRLSLGDTPAEAAAVARDQFLNYDIRAPWINAARRTMLPFIGYTYRAIPIIARSIAHRPWKLAKYATIAYLANALAYMLAPGDEDEERRSMREEAQGYTWVGVPRMLRMPWRDEHGMPVFLDIRRWIPAGDVFDTNQGQAALPIPAPLQFGGPLMLGAELALNKQAFTGDPITNELTDTAGEKAMKVAGWAWKSWMPGAAWIPGSWYWDKIERAATGGRDMLGRDYSMAQALASSAGIKLAPQDVQFGMQVHAWQFERVARELKAQARQLNEDRERGLLSEEQFRREMGNVERKWADLGDRAQETFSGAKGNE